MTFAPSGLRSAWHRFLIVSLVAILFGVVATSSLVAPRAAASGSTPLTGWLWSDTTGWISLNCSSDPNGCSKVNYGVSVDGSGNLSGYGWSDSVGWVSFNAGQLSGCPQTQTGNTSCAPMLIGGSAFKGWARACYGMDDTSLNQSSPNNTCTNADGTRTDGSDGWISLYGASPIAYGPTIAQSGAMSGYAWGSDVNGWILFQGSAPQACQTLVPPTYCGGSPDQNTIYENDTLGNQCMVSTCSYECVSGSCVAPPQAVGTFTVAPQIVNANNTGVSVSWNVQNVTSCTASSSPNVGSWSQTSDASSTSAAGPFPSGDIAQQTTFSINCPGLGGASPFQQSVIVDFAPQFQER